MAAKTTLTAAETGAWTGLVRASQGVLDHIEAALKQNGLPALAWYDVLLELNREADGRLRLNQLGGRVLLRKDSVTRLVDRLVARALVKREPCPDDARGAFAVITRKGRAMLKRMWPVYHDAVRAHFLGHLNEAEISDLAELMKRINVANR